MGYIRTMDATQRTPTKRYLESLLESDIMEKLEITIAVDHQESEQFCAWLIEQGHAANVGSSTGNYINGEPTGSSDELNIKMNSLWDSYCNSNGGEAKFESKPLIDWPTEFCFDGFVAWADEFCFDVSLRDSKKKAFNSKFTRRLLKAWQAGILNENKKDASNLEEDHFSLAEYDEQRTQFIAWAKEQERGINVKRTKDGDDNFRSETTHSLWEAWQAGTLFSRRTLRQGIL